MFALSIALTCTLLAALLTWLAFRAERRRVAREQFAAARVDLAVGFDALAAVIGTELLAELVTAAQTMNEFARAVSAADWRTAE